MTNRAIKLTDTVTLTREAAAMLEVDSNTLYEVTFTQHAHGVTRYSLTPITEPPTLNATVNAYDDEVVTYRG